MADQEETWKWIAAGLQGRPPDSEAAKVLRTRIAAIAATLRIPTDVDLEDAVQTTWIRLIDGEMLAAAVSGEAVVRMTLRWVIVDQIRRLRREQALRRRLAREPNEQEAGLDASFESAEGRQLSRSRIEALIGTATSDERRLLELRFWEERSIQSIADLLGISYSAAAVRIFRLLKRLRDRAAST